VKLDAFETCGFAIVNRGTGVGRQKGIEDPANSANTSSRKSP